MDHFRLVYGDFFGGSRKPIEVPSDDYVAPSYDIERMDAALREGGEVIMPKGLSAQAMMAWMDKVSSTAE